MKKILLLCSLIPSLCYSEEIVQFSGVCDETNSLLNQIKKYDEIPVAAGTLSGEEKARFSLWMNPKTKAWTIVYTKNNQSCVVGVGDKLKIVMPGPSM